MQPRVTVITATYNRSEVLHYAVRSVLRQTFRDYEMLVVGDACTDDSEQVVNAFGDPRVRWINLPKRTTHQSSPNNEGLRQARGGIIAYLGHDDLWLPHSLSVLVGALDATGADMAHSFPMNVAADEVSAWPVISHRGYAAPTCTVHRRNVVDRIGFWREPAEITISPDVDFFRRILAAGLKTFFVRRMTAVKFPGSWRRDVYLTHPSHEQAAWTERIEADPDFEASQLARFLADTPVPTGMPYRVLLRHVAEQTVSRIRRRLQSPFRRYRTVEEIRRFKGA